ncbi:MAG TPA: ribonuclease III [Thermoanaerobaculia bacterium]|nr:ribonuclease III [Thermoanaerobaculia bacterium]
MALVRRPSPLERRLGYRFRRPELLDQALTHRSWAHEQEDPERHYERLEFLGDAVLGLITAEELFREHPDLPEGELSKRKSFLVSREVLARRGEELGLGELLRLGVGEERSGGREKASLLADAVEAVLGAVYLDGGIAAARQVVSGLFAAGLARPAAPELDAKTRLQETVQGRGWPLPVYRLVDTAGPDHDKRFTVEVRLQGEPAGVGRGRSKKIAEQEAAAVALAALDAAPSPVER